MNNQHKEHVINTVISLLDIFVILSIEEFPNTGIILSVLLKTVTRDPVIRLLLILLVIILGEVMTE